MFKEVQFKEAFAFLSRYSPFIIHQNEERIVVRGNRFNENMGSIGGAMTINLKNAPLILKDNQFNSNFGIVAGGAIFISLMEDCSSVVIDHNEFNGNSGYIKNIGGAIAIVS